MQILLKKKTNWKFILIIIIIAIISGGGVLWYQNKTELIYNFIELNKTQEKKFSDEELKEKIGQMIMIGFRGTTAEENSNIYKIIKDIKIGGVVLSDYDVPSNSFPRNIINPEQTKKLISDLQKYPDIPLFIAVDAEGGNVNRLKQKYGFLPILSAEKMGQDKTLKTTEEESAKLANELKNLGFNMNLAPVVDLNINPENPIIGALGRSFSANSEEVLNNVRVFIENHLNNNVITVAKHFPGHGSSTEDTHLGLADVTDTYEEEELFPYQKLNEEGMLNVVMVGHIVNKKIDSVYPATLSKNFLQEILRKKLGFKGVIMSDDMQMTAISNNYKLDETVIMAINAGCDIVYFFNNTSSGYDKDIAYKVRDIIFNAVKENKIEEKRIIESYNRIINLKKQFKIIQSAAEKAAEIKAKIFELIGLPNALNFGEALDIAKYVEGITKTRPAFLLAIFQEELSLVKEFSLCYLKNTKTGEGVRITDGKRFSKVMHPERDMKDFLELTKELGMDPYKTPVTCPMSFGWGGAMGPADFIPSTWMRYKDKIKEISGKTANPWDINDAFLASGLYLSESGAALGTREGEWDAAMIYFSNSPESGFNWYANNTLKISDKLEVDIETIEKAR
jgi:beta-N-acetylhexosaminidase